MARVAFYLETRNISSLDVREVDAGNPGMGGTEYMFFLVAAHLARKHEVTMYITAEGRYPEGIRYILVRDFHEAAGHAEAGGDGILVIREPEVLPNAEVLARLKATRVLVWAHNYSGHKTLKACVRIPAIARYLCVSREQYEGLRDEDVFGKADYVFNAVATSRYPFEPAQPEGANVFYMGSLVEAKGFHILARCWDRIVDAVPTARLHVVGSGRLYDRRASLGPLGLASEDYERRFAPYLTREGRLRDDVWFHGDLGTDKAGLLAQASVAVANPTGVGETFCITALEFALLGVPVVTKRLGGPINVIEDGVTGILYKDERELPGAVIALLKDRPRRFVMGRAAAQRARERFDIAVVLEKWEEILRQVCAGESMRPDYRITGSDKTWKEWNRRLRRLPVMKGLPSVDYWTHAIRKKKHSLFVKPFRRFGSFE